MTGLAATVRFPAHRFVSKAEFDEHCLENQADLDARYAYELGFATADATLVRRGTCAPCLRPTQFTARTAGGERRDDGRRLPNWREELTCECEDALGSRPRALLHFVESVVGVQPWTRALVFGPPTNTDRRIAAMVGSARSIRQLDGGHRLAAENAAFHLVVAAEALQRVPPLDAALAEIRRVLAPGGQLAFTVPFRYRAERTQSQFARGAGLPSETNSECHEIGWDILVRLRSAGFAQASAYVYWSRELGYYGPFNLIFGAVA